jgi:thiol-disulfide isomerase/thioredoxin
LLSSRSLTLVALACALAAPAFLAGCDRQSGKGAQPRASQSGTPAAGVTLPGVADRSHAGTPLPDFTVGDPGGRKLRLQDLKGAPVLINLWATWCAPCVKELPQLDALAKAGKLKVVAVSQDMGEPDKVAAFLKDHKVTHLDAWLDPQDELTFRYGTGTLPTTVLYDAQGREVWRYIGGQDWTSAEAGKLLAEASPAA